MINFVQGNGVLTSTLSGAGAVNYDPDYDVYAVPTRPLYPSSARAAFGALLTAREEPVIALSFNYSINSLFVVTGTVNGGTVTQSSSMAVLSSSTSSSGSASLESRAAIRYVPGQGATAKFTAIFTTGSNGDSLQEIGIGDANDGFFFAVSGSNFGIIRRRSGSDTFVSQSAWNGAERYDGITGPALDITKGNVYKINYQWLGYGAIRFFVEDPNNGTLDLVHTIKFANANTLPSILNPTLPLQMRVLNRGGTTDIKLMSPSMGAYTEGPIPEIASPGATGSSTSITTTELPICSIQVTGTFQGKTNRVRTQLHSIAVASAAAAGVASFFRLRLNPVLGASSFTALDVNTSTINTDAAATASTGGRVLFQTMTNGQQSTVENIESLNIVIGPGDILTLTGQSLSGGGAVLAGSINWNELFSG